MLDRIKRFFYFPVASYFRFFASIRMYFWNPKVIVITGSSGKTTLLNLVESQLGTKAKYSYKANSSFGIPFDILGLHRKDLTILEWPLLFVLTPLAIFKKLPTQNLYVVEADCDRQGEGNFLSSLLNPAITLWINVSRTHSANFSKDGFASIDEAIAHEFSYFAKRTKLLVIANTDNPLIKAELEKVSCEIQPVSIKNDLKEYSISLSGTTFNLKGDVFTFPFLLPEQVATSVLMSLYLTEKLSVAPDKSFSRLHLPPGRNSFFKGIKGITIVDSTYNANLDSMGAIINMYGQINLKDKWVVLGDMLEQGSQEEEEHEKLAAIIASNKFSRIILMGPRISEYTYPKLRKLINADVKVEHFLGPVEVLNYLLKNIKGGEAILFKGSRFLEGVIEKLLKNKNDALNLARREKVWDLRRKKWGL